MVNYTVKKNLDKHPERSGFPRSFHMYLDLNPEDAYPGYIRLTLLNLDTDPFDLRIAHLAYLDLYPGK